MTLRDQISASSSILSSFPARLALAQLADGGVLLDLFSGAVFTLNTGATRICAGLALGKAISEIEEEFAASFQLAPDAATRDVRAVLADLEAVTSDAPDASSPRFLHFEADPNGYLMRWEDEIVLHIDPPGRTVTYQADPARIAVDPAHLLKWAVPHLLALQHQPVLHASAVQQDNGILAFAGFTGAGKTTLARAFAAAGARPVSEDLLVISPDQGIPLVLVDGESVLHNWAADKSLLLAGRPPVQIDAGGLREAVRGPAVPLQEILLIDSAQRSGDTIGIEMLAGPDSLVTLLRHGFAELQQRDIWMELLETAQAIVSSVPVHRATLPDGLAALPAAIRGYNAMTASYSSGLPPRSPSQA